jgi:WD40 repeat protein
MVAGGAQETKAEPELVVQTGHAAPIRSLAFNTDGSLLVSGDRDGAVVLWDIKTGRQLRAFTRLAPSFADIQKVAFTADDRQIVVLGGGITILDITSGEQAFQSSALTGAAWDYARITNLAAYSDHGNITIFSLAERKTLSAFKAPTTVVESLAFAPDGKKLAVGSGMMLDSALKKVKGSRKMVTLHDVISGARLCTVSTPGDFISALAFSSDGSLLATASYNDTQSLNLVAQSTVVLWDAKTGNKTRQLPVTSATNSIRCLAFESDGKAVAAAIQDELGHNNDLKTNLWSVQSGQPLPVVGDASGEDAVAFHPTAHVVAMAVGGTIQLWDTDRSREVYRLRQRVTRDILSAVIVPGRNLTTITTDWGMLTWNLATGGLDRVEEKRFFGETKLSPNGKLLSTVFNGQGSITNLEIRDALSGNLQFALPSPAPGARIQSYYSGRAVGSPFSSDGRLFAYVTYSDFHGPRNIEIWDVSAGHRIAAIAERSDLDYLCFLPDDKTLVTTTLGDHAVRNWEVATGRLVATADAKAGFPVLLGHEWKRLQRAPFGEMLLRDPADNRVLQSFRPPETESVKQFYFSPSGRYLAGAADNTHHVLLWNVATGKLLSVSAGHAEDLSNLVFSSDERVLMSAGHDGVCRFWSTESGKLMVTLLPINQADAPTRPTEWIAFTPDNYFVASKQALTAVAFRVGNHAYPLEQFDLKYDRPDIVLQRLGFASTQIVDAYHAAYQKRLKIAEITEDQLKVDSPLPELAVDSANLPYTTSNPRLEFTVAATDAASTIERMLVQVNNVPSRGTLNGVAFHGTKGYSFHDPQLQHFAGKVSIDLSTGANKIQVSVRNHAGVDSLIQTFTVNYTPKTLPKPDLYVVAVGVSVYRNSKYNLDYAARDADDIATLFQSKDAHFGHVKVLRLLNEKATLSHILEAHDFLAQSQIEDEVVVFIAGHGMLDSNLSYYFGTYDVDFAGPAGTGLAYEAIEGLLDDIPARRKLLFMDTCHAGEIDKSDTLLLPVPEGVKVRSGVHDAATGLAFAPKIGLANSFALMQDLFVDLRRGTGTQIIAAASGVQFAYERGSHGVFTQALLEGLTQGRTKVSALDAYTRSRVRELTNGQQTPTVRHEDPEYDFDVY